ncbi:MAG: hypothetical protein OHK0024_04620 [Thalassobaculales bacterium]
MLDAVLGDIAGKGYAVVDAFDPAPLAEIRATIFQAARGLLGWEGNDPDAFFNHFHDQALDAARLNDFRVALIRAFNEQADVGRLTWDAFAPLLLSLVGPDAAVQRATNLVIQMPHDLAVSPVHRDAPPNSLHEVVVWVPLVDCYGTKGMVVLSAEHTREALARRAAPGGGDAAMDDYVWSVADRVAVPYGKALFFWAGLIHAVPENVETETRWSLNLRYKNIFSPQGTKGMPEYFRILHLSPLSRLAFDAQRRQAVADLNPS